MFPWYCNINRQASTSKRIVVVSIWWNWSTVLTRHLLVYATVQCQFSRIFSHILSSLFSSECVLLRRFNTRWSWMIIQSSSFTWLFDCNKTLTAIAQELSVEVENFDMLSILELRDHWFRRDRYCAQSQKGLYKMRLRRSFFLLFLVLLDTSIIWSNWE